MRSGSWWGGNDLQRMADGELCWREFVGVRFCSLFIVRNKVALDSAKRRKFIVLIIYNLYQHQLKVFQVEHFSMVASF